MQIIMIRIAEHPVSVMYSRICEDSWKKFGYKINFFDAVTPKDLVYRNELTFKKDRYSDTEKAVWYSHYDLWVECAKRHETMIVLEHDSFLHKKIDDLKNHKFKFLSFINRDFGNNKGRYLAPGSGYFVRPEVARALVDRAKNNTIQQQLDGFISVTNWEHWKQIGRLVDKKSHEEVIKVLPIEQINIDGWNTIDHNNPNRKFIGDNYEDFDLSGVHGES